MRAQVKSSVRANLVLRLLPIGVVRFLAAINALAALTVCAIFIWFGSDVVNIAILIDEHSQTGVSFPMWIYYLALPVGAALMAIRYVLLLVSIISKKGSVTKEGLMREASV